jgi:hypothetical protein
VQLMWRPLLANFDVPAKPAGVWTKVLDYVGPSRKLRFIASGTWCWQDPSSLPNHDAPGSSETRRECGPDGDLSATPSKGCLTQEAPVGALIGKIGGSTATVQNMGAFVVGAFCVYDVSDAMKGPLFLTINDMPAGMSDNNGKIVVSIWESV